MKAVRDSVRRHPVVAVLLGLSTLGLFIDQVKRLITSTSAVDWLIKKGVRSPTSAPVEIAFWFELTVWLTFCALIVVVGMYWITQSELNDLAPPSQGAFFMLEGMINAVYKIRQQLIPHDKDQFRSFPLVKSIYYISNSFSANVIREYWLKASKESIHFFEVSVGAESEAPPMENLHDIKFHATDNSSHGRFDVAYLPCENHSHQKRVLIYCLPFVDPSEINPRVVTVTYEWDAYFRHLELTGQETLRFSFPLTPKDIDRLECEVYLEPGTGKKLRCTAQGSAGGQQLLQPVTTRRENSEWDGYKYTISPAPAGEYALQLELVDA